MERLTKVMHCDDGNKLYDYSNEVVRECKDFSSRLQLMFEKLAHYEDLEEQGLLLKLPCKVGDKLYYIAEYMNGECEIMSNTMHSIRDILRFTDNMGSGFYITKEEAEAKLKEMEGE